MSLGAPEDMPNNGDRKYMELQQSTRWGMATWGLKKNIISIDEFLQPTARFCRVLQDVHQAIAEVDPVFAVNAVYVYEQAWNSWRN